MADDHEMIRKGLHALLACDGGIDVVGEARDGREAVEMTRALRPDVVLMDVAMPRLNGIEATRQIVDAVPATRILMLSAHGDAEYVARALESGAAGYVLKQTSLTDLAAAIRAARAAPQPSHDDGGARRRSRRPNAPLRCDRLTSRESEILQAIAESRGNKEIARELGISVKTVEKHRQSLMRKLDIHDVAGLTQYAVRTGVVECCAGASCY